MKIRFSFFILLFFLFYYLCPVFAEDEAFQLAIQNADQRIQNFDQAVQSGDSQQVRQAALELQKDPLAVRRVNENRDDAFKSRLNQETTGVQSEAKAKIRRRLAEHYQVPEEKITFFEATNPSDEIKVGQDWDVTARVDGVDVPLDVAKPVVEEAFYEAAKGKKPSSPQEAHDFAHQQAVEPINYEADEAYGYGGDVEVKNPKTGEVTHMSEGGDIISGEKGGNLRDSEQLRHTMRNKSDRARNAAQDIRQKAETKIEAEGLTGEAADEVLRQAEADAQAWEMEEARQHTKQQARQMETRVEAMGGKVPQQVEEGNKILDKVAKGEISPAEGRRQLAEIGETPESIIDKGSGLHEAGQKLVSPQKTIERAEALKAQGRDDVLTHNVQQRMKLNDIERRAALKKEGLSDAEIEARLKREPAGSLAEIIAKSRNAGIDAPQTNLQDTGGKSSFRRTSTATERIGLGMDAMEAAGEVAESYMTEAENAIEEGREISQMNVAKETGRKVLGGSQYDMSHQISSEEIAKSDAKGESRVWAFGRSVGENIRQRLGGGAYDMSQQINEEEAKLEIERAQREGRAASPARAKINAASRVAAEMTGMRSVADAVYFDEDAERQAKTTQDKLQERAKNRLEEGLIKTGLLEDQIRDLEENWDTSDPVIQDELQALKEEYNRTKSETQERLQRLQESSVFDHSDPEYQAISQAVSLMEEKVTVNVAALQAEIDSHLSGCQFDKAHDAIQKLPPEQREAAQGRFQKALANENQSFTLVQNAKNQLASNQPSRSLFLLDQALKTTKCETNRADILAEKNRVQQQIQENAKKKKPKTSAPKRPIRPLPEPSRDNYSRSSRLDMSGVVNSLAGLLQQRQQSRSSTPTRRTGAGYDGIFSNNNNRSSSSGFAASNPVYSSNSSRSSGSSGQYYAGFGKGPGAAMVGNSTGYSSVSPSYSASSSSRSGYSSGYSNSSSEKSPYELGTTSQNW